MNMAVSSQMLGLPSHMGGAPTITINVHGAGDPRLVAENVFAAFNRELSLRGGAL
jgi:hypothetical protein